MSAHKKTTVTIPLNDYSQVIEEEILQTYIDLQLRSEWEQSNRDAINQLWSNYEVISSQQQEIVHQLSTLDEDIGIDETNQLLVMQEAQTQILESITKSVEDTSIQANKDWMEEISLIIKELSERISITESNILEIKQINYQEKNTLRNKYLEFEKWRNAVSLLISNILRLQHMPIFDNSQIQEFIQYSQNIEESLSNENVSMCTQQFMNLFHEINNYEIYLMKEYTEITTWQTLARVEANRISFFLKSLIPCPAVGLDGHTIDRHFDLNEWTGGKFGDYFSKLDKLINRLNSDQPTYKIQEYQMLLFQKLPNFENQIKKMVQKTRKIVLSSQLRVNIADVIVKTFSQNGYQLSKCEYIENDPRKGYFAELIDPFRHTVTVRVDPLKIDDFQSDIQFAFSDAPLRTEHELTRRTDEIRKSLNLAGIEVGEIKVTDPILNEATTNKATRIGQLKGSTPLRNDY